MKFGDFDMLTFDVVGPLIDFETGILDWFRPTLRRYEDGFGATPRPEKVVTPTFHATSMADFARQVREEQRSSGIGETPEDFGGA